LAKHDEIRGFIRGISDEEFEIFLKLAFTLNGFIFDNKRRSVINPNDFLLTLVRYEKRGILLRKEKKISYVAYIDRKQQEYSIKWINDFMNRSNSYDTYLQSFEKIFVMNMNKIKKIDLPKELKRKIKFINGKKFFDFCYNVPAENIAFLERLYPNESQMWDNKKPEEQKEFCEHVGIDYIRYARLWKYPIGLQSKLIFSLQNGTGKKKSQKQEEKEERYSYSSSSDLKKYYDILGAKEDDSPSEIKKKFREEIKFFHPDKFESKSPEDKDTAKKKAQKINVAYEELKKAGKAD